MSAPVYDSRTVAECKAAADIVAARMLLSDAQEALGRPAAIDALSNAIGFLAMAWGALKAQQ